MAESCLLSCTYSSHFPTLITGTEKNFVQQKTLSVQLPDLNRVLDPGAYMGRLMGVGPCRHKPLDSDPTALITNHIAKLVGKPVIIPMPTSAPTPQEASQRP